MKNANNDNDTWTSIGLQAALIVNKLRVQAQLSDNFHSVNSAECIGVDNECLCGIVEKSEMKVAATMRNSGPPRLPVLLGGTGNALEAGGVVPKATPIGLVHGAGCIAQIEKPIVESIAIDVVNSAMRPITVDDQPNQTMSEIHFIANLDSHIVLATTSCGPTKRAPMLPSFPEEVTSIGTILEFGPGFVCSNHGSPITENEQEQSTDDAKRRDADEQKRKEHKAYVDQGLRNIRAFERRARGNKN